MKRRIWVVIVNISIMLAMLIFVVIYSVLENRNTTQRQIEHYQNTAITMEHVTENYLEGEQRICDVWAHHINYEELTMDEAIDFIRNSHVLTSASAHIVYKDTLTGSSTRAREDGTGNAVSYANMEFLKDVSWIRGIGESAVRSRQEQGRAAAALLGGTRTCCHVQVRRVLLRAVAPMGSRRQDVAPFVGEGVRPHTTSQGGECMRGGRRLPPAEGTEPV